MQRIALDIFEGPLDLLLHLIKKEDLDIYDIPVARLLGQYLEFLDMARDLDIDLAGEFLEMAAELAYIKSRMLLPEADPETEEEGPDPREDLVKRLLEYQKFKLAAQQIHQRPILGRDVFVHPPLSIDASDDPLVETDMTSLLLAFQEVLKRLSAQQVHEIRGKIVGTAEKMIYLTEFLRGKKVISFEELFEGDRTRSEVVVTFLTVLEMCRQNLLKILQDKIFDRIVITSLIDTGIDTATDTVPDTTIEGPTYGT